MATAAGGAGRVFDAHKDGAGINGIPGYNYIDYDYDDSSCNII
jgi:hypothetical protein